MSLPSPFEVHGTRPDQSEVEALRKRLEFLEARNIELEMIEQEMQGLLQEIRVQHAELRAQNGELKQIREELDASHRKYKTLFDQAPIGYLTLDQYGRLLDLNVAAAQLFGFPKAQLRHGHLSLNVAEKHRARLSVHLERVFTGRHDTVEVSLVGIGGREIPVVLRSVPVVDPLDCQPRSQTAVMDVSEHRAAEVQLRKARDYLQHLAHHDTLTDLPNRLLFKDRLDHALQRARRRGSKVALLFLDLDRFKQVNDSLGHQVGDQMLCEIAARISSQVRSEDTVARLGGDEFTVILEDIEQVSDVESIASKLLSALGAPLMLGGQEFIPSVSIGISVYPSDATEVDDLVRYADSAMFRAKELGRGVASFFTPELNASILNRLELEADLRKAVEGHNLSLHYQPQFYADSGRIAGVEALARWQHPVRGMVMPADFIPVAEDAKLIGALGGWALAEACRQFSEWRATGVDVERVAVNLSAGQLTQPDLCSFIRRILAEERMPAGCLELELTESALLSDPDAAIDVFAELRAMGVQIAIDDFGTGYSSLSRLRQLPLSRLKIDGSFVRGVESRPDDQAIARAIISMAHDLNLGVVSEGVETREQRSFLEGCGCDVLQGFHLARPVPPSQMGQNLTAQAA